MVEAVGGEGEVTELRVSLVGGYRDEAGISQQVGDSISTHYTKQYLNCKLTTLYLHSINTISTQVGDTILQVMAEHGPELRLVLDIYSIISIHIYTISTQNIHNI